MKKEDLFERLENGTKVFKNPAIKAAFQAVDRKDFAGDDYAIEAYEDYPLPLGFGQAISQPTTVAFMLELLDAKPADNVLDIGSGSGWTTALLAHIVGKEGKVMGLEIIPNLVAVGQKNLKKYKDLAAIAEIKLATDETGLFKNGPYNRILASASFPDKETAPVELLLQLLVGGVMVVPIGESIWKFEKISEDDYYETEYPGFIFVPYVSK